MRALENADRIREALARLPTASRADLRAEWLRLYGCAPPSKLRRELLMAAIAYRFVSEKTIFDNEDAFAAGRPPSIGILCRTFPARLNDPAAGWLGRSACKTAGRRLSGRHVPGTQPGRAQNRYLNFSNTTFVPSIA